MGDCGPRSDDVVIGSSRPRVELQLGGSVGTTVLSDGRQEVTYRYSHASKQRTTKIIYSSENKVAEIHGYQPPPGLSALQAAEEAQKQGLRYRTNPNQYGLEPPYPLVPK